MSESVHSNRVLTSVSLASLVFEGSVRSEGQNSDHIQAMVEAEWPLPPILIHGPTMRIIDGFHRAVAAQIKGLTLIDAYLVDAADDEIFMLAVRENVTHGLPLSLSDRRAAATRILSSHPTWSDRSIGSVTGLSDKTVAGIRRATADHPQLQHRLGRDGRNRPTSPAAARQLAAELIQHHPEASLRDIAQQVGVSPSTVRDVRLRLSRGQSPVRPPRAVPALRDEPTPNRSKATAPGAPIDITTILTVLSRDPALRMNTNGRELIRWLHAHAVNPDEAQRIFSAIPPHCADHLVELAQRCATNWACIAESLAAAPSKLTTTAVS
ncbi:ParB/RepB/Spo0J family partition protein [Mycolicibacterium fluoranthenivorans]|uniref:Winged helix-turn-helix DNA-binding n=1 Tax=Mycolicibacterium fluoranthenivorans TaxID=258505 RepID=A0A1G4WSG5_9MYCO|nr:ParB N-terminal domain-containing protein [Mycolicibacterium fluoranthenivorans]SCX28046.1 Winged helix-turn-helix DNA-binding [Mycolicibacterium fluoranthenivorans]